MSQQATYVQCSRSTVRCNDCLFVCCVHPLVTPQSATCQRRPLVSTQSAIRECCLAHLNVYSTSLLRVLLQCWCCCTSCSSGVTVHCTRRRNDALKGSAPGEVKEEAEDDEQERSGG